MLKTRDTPSPARDDQLPEMRGITVRQPWAWGIIFAGKLIENRTQLWRYRGLLAIHAARSVSLRGQRDPRIAEAMRDWRRNHTAYMPMLPLGVIIGYAELVDVHPASGCCHPWGEQEYQQADGKRRPRLTHLVLEKPRQIQPMPYSGRQGLWRLPADDIAEVLRRRTHDPADHVAWFTATGHCGGCGNPGNYCTCSQTSPCGCRHLHPVGSASTPDALAAFTDQPLPAIDDGQTELFATSPASQR